MPFWPRTTPISYVTRTLDDSRPSVSPFPVSLTNIQPITKRRIALLRSMGRIAEAVSSLIQLLDFSPTDTEAWAELADLYVSQGLYPQAIYALEEVLVKAPNAWNVCNLPRVALAGDQAQS